MDTINPLVIESLPAIDIGVGPERLLFLERIVSLVGNGAKLTVERHHLSLGVEELHFVNLILSGSSGRSKSGGQLIVRPDANRVCLEMYSTDWDGGHPKRATYVGFARAFFQPILTRYNRHFGTRHRLRIVKSKGYVMPPETKTLFDRFARLANTWSLHPLDWERFYLFVRHSRSKVPEGHLRPLLVDRGFSAEKAQMLSELYDHLWDFKKLRS